MHSASTTLQIYIKRPTNKGDGFNGRGFNECFPVSGIVSEVGDLVGSEYYSMELCFESSVCSLCAASHLLFKV